MEGVSNMVSSPVTTTIQIPLSGAPGSSQVLAVRVRMPVPSSDDPTVTTLSVDTYNYPFPPEPLHATMCEDIERYIDKEIRREPDTDIIVVCAVKIITPLALPAPVIKYLLRRKYHLGSHSFHITCLLARRGGVPPTHGFLLKIEQVLD